MVLVFGCRGTPWNIGHGCIARFATSCQGTVRAYTVARCVGDTGRGSGFWCVYMKEAHQLVCHHIHCASICHPHTELSCLAYLGSKRDGSLMLIKSKIPLFPSLTLNLLFRARCPFAPSKSSVTHNRTRSRHERPLPDPCSSPSHLVLSRQPGGGVIGIGITALSPRYNHTRLVPRAMNSLAAQPPPPSITKPITAAAAPVSAPPPQ